MDDLVQSVQCYNPKSLLFHGYLAPFFVIQLAVFYCFSDTDQHSHEIRVIAVTVSVAAQIVTYLFSHWSVDVKCWLSYSKCNDPYRSQFVKVTPTPNNGSTELVRLRRETIAKQNIVWFLFQKTKYIFDTETTKFVTTSFPCDEKISHYKQWKGYTDQRELQLVEKKFGRNELEMVIPQFKELFIERMTAPFFVFQTFCVGLWCLDEFWYYALMTLCMLVIFEIVLVKHQLRNMQEIRRMGNQPFMVQVFRENKWKPIKSDLLVSGDLVSIVRSDQNIPCDILLVKGSCIIDESTLTGESVPQMKEPIEDIVDDDRKLDVDQDKLHILYAGTKILQHTPTNKDQSCVGYVLRTGFNTSQGKLLRTILFGVKRVTANNFETFCFIMFLLFFAVISACYVWNQGVQDPKRSRYRLFFECAVIITSVVPPELPIELSLAVNTSLLSLSKLYIYCTEPFRIPFAGKVEYCCFDKTGTLTSDDLIVEGVAGLPENETAAQPHDSSDDMKLRVPSKTISTPELSKHKMVMSVDNCPQYTVQVLASCHSLAHLDEKLVGDPLEKKVLEAINWNYSKSGTVSARRGKLAPLRIHQRYHFNSTLKRMSVIASYRMDMSNENVYICTAKGAPEFMRPLLKDIPANYDEIYLQMSRLGARVLALGYKTLGQLTNSDLQQLNREDVEKDLMFAGFILISCPLKPDSKAVCMELKESGHRLVMITGDGALTACHVASELNFVTQDVLILTKTGQNEWKWISTDQNTVYPFGDNLKELLNIYRKYDLCLTGDSLEYLTKNEKDKTVYEIVRRVKVFARVSPKQKELIITTIKSGGQTVLMCGDGTNDVGALKHADVGVALLASSPVRKIQQTHQEMPSQSNNDENTPPGKQAAVRKPKKQVANAEQPGISNLSPEARRREKMLEAQAKLRQLLAEEDGFVKLGDASIAAPFTSRLSSIQCISHIIKQGRCTLVTTLQMFKILALNALLSAYCHSVLYLNGIKYSEGQFTLQGIFNTLCFLFLTRAQPLKKLSSLKPLPNIFNFYTILTVTLQFLVHFSSLLFLYNQAKAWQELTDEKDPLPDLVQNATLTVPESTSNSSIVANSTTTEDIGESLHTKFEPSLINSTVYIISMSVQLATFVVNYKGHPFMQRLSDNRPLMYIFSGSLFLIFVCVNGWSPSLTEQLSIVDFPVEFRPIVLSTIVLNFGLAYAIDRACEYMFGRLYLKPLS